MNAYYRVASRLLDLDPSISIDLLRETLSDDPIQAIGNHGNTAMTTISQETRFCLDEYRGFRHVVRKGYTFNLRPLLVERTDGEPSTCYQRLDAELAGFVAFLSALDKDEP